MRLLLLSNSTNPGEEYLGYSKSIIQNFLSDHADSILFIPYAGVSIAWEDYTNQVNEALYEYGIQVKPVYHTKNPKKLFQNASAVMVGGGNSFQLLKQLQDLELMEVIRNCIKEGIPYVGWSAGANIACPSLKTTNDMPILEPHSFQSLGLVHFQINPHYTEEVLPNHGGESRPMRIEEYTKVNPGSKVIGLPEGMMLQNSGRYFNLIGEKGCKIFQYGIESRWIYSDKELNEFLQN